MLTMNGLFLGVWKHPFERGVGPCFRCYLCYFSISIFLYFAKKSDLFFFSHNTSVVFLVFNLYIVQ